MLLLPRLLLLRWLHFELLHLLAQFGSVSIHVRFEARERRLHIIVNWKLRHAERCVRPPTVRILELLVAIRLVERQEMDLLGTCRLLIDHNSQVPVAEVVLRVNNIAYL